MTTVLVRENCKITIPDEIRKFAGSGQVLVDEEDADLTIKQLCEDRNIWIYLR
ncbi:hypothetical protein [Acinetobacter populi]|uniref:hypothetical protein n=1 Tax=Acinetobacter populi TaxID=1582270 RepID=UPI00148CB7C0|nr:hypothetical protein [Acinetobacter populi]